MAAVANHDFWKEYVKRDEKIRNRREKKVDESRCEVSTELIPVYERTTTTIKKEKIYVPPLHQTVYTCHPRNVAAPKLIKNTLKVEDKLDHRPALHLVNSCPQMKTCKLPIFHKSPSAGNMANKSEDIVKMKHACAENAVVENVYLHPVEVKNDHRPALHLVNSCPQRKTGKLPIFHKSPSAGNMANKLEVKMKHACTENAVVENVYLHPIVLKKRYPTVHTEEVKLEPHLISTIGDQGIPFRERLWVVKE